jgi:negative regulator of sigma-B (phosphoserine phosphatase)
MTAIPSASMSLSPLPIAWGVSSRAFGAAAETGDLHVVVPCAQTVLVAAIDGLGHGREAALAARAAAAVLERHGDEPLIELMQRCHAELRRTRGVALSMASFDLRASTMTWLGVGNVEGVLFRADRSQGSRRDSLMPRGGVVGYRIPSLRPAELHVGGGDVLVFATDGVRTSFSACAPVNLVSQEAADAILARYGKETDDALALVVRYLGWPR